MEAEIKPLTLQDLPEILPLEQLLFDFPFSYQQYLFELEKNRHSAYFKLTQNEEILGWFGVMCLFEEAQIITIGVRKEAQGKGYGSKLLKYCEDYSKDKGCKVLFLEVDETNTPAKKLYQKHGFEIVRIRKNYYHHHDGIEMKKELI